jgi:hypothetical protein
MPNDVKSPEMDLCPDFSRVWRKVWGFPFTEVTKNLDNIGKSGNVTNYALFENGLVLFNRRR